SLPRHRGRPDLPPPPSSSRPARYPRPMLGPSRLDVITAGHRGDLATATAGLDSPDPTIRAAALGALTRLGPLDEGLVLAGPGDPVRAGGRRGGEVAAALGA